MPSNIEKLQTEYRDLEVIIQAVAQAIADSQGMFNARLGIKTGFVVLTNLGHDAALRCDPSIEIMSDALHKVLALKKERLQVVKAKLAAIEELLKE